MTTSDRGHPDRSASIRTVPVSQSQADEAQRRALARAGVMMRADDVVLLTAYAQRILDAMPLSERARPDRERVRAVKDGLRKHRADPHDVRQCRFCGPADGWPCADRRRYLSDLVRVGLRYGVAAYRGPAPLP